MKSGQKPSRRGADDPHPLSVAATKRDFVPTKLRPKPRADVKAEAIRLYWEGEPIKEICKAIAEKFGVEISTTMPGQWACENGAAHRSTKPRSKAR